MVLESRVLDELMVEKKTSWKMDSEIVLVVSVMVPELAKLCFTISVEVSDIYKSS